MKNNASRAKTIHESQRDGIRPRISVVVPAYNVERYIDSALNSLIHQTMKFHQIIVVNDGSTDSTRQRLQKYEENALIIIVDQANSGQGPARNMGMQRVTGDYVYFFDSDDLLDCRFVENISSLIESDDGIDLLFFSGESFFDQGFSSSFFPNYRRKLSGSFATGIDAAEALSRVGWFFPGTPFYVSRKAIWDKNRLLFAPILHEDEELILRLCSSAGKTIVSDEVFYRRRLRPSSTMTTSISASNVTGILQAFVSTARICLECEALRTTHKAFARARLNDLCRDYLQYCRDIKVHPRVWMLLRTYWTLWWLPPRQLMARAFGFQLH